MRRISRKLGRDRHHMTCIIDLKGLSLRHISRGTLAVLQQRTRLEEDNYPEVRQGLRSCLRPVQPRLTVPSPSLAAGGEARLPHQHTYLLRVCLGHRQAVHGPG